MEGFIKNIDERAEQNISFRQVILTSSYVQVVLMSIPVGSDVGEEVHEDTDQILYLEDGHGKAILDGQEQNFDEGDLVLVKAGTKHNFINTGDEDMKIITFYAPPHHPQGTVHKTKEEAMKSELGY